MNFGHVMFSPNGRISQQDYWIGILVIIGANIVSSFIPFLGLIAWFVLIWCGIAVYGKRLHDAGKSAWLHIIPWLLTIVFSVVGIVMIMGSALSVGLSSNGEDLSPDQIMTLIAGGGSGIGVMMLPTLIWIGYTIWVGVMKGDPEANAHGPVPGGAVTPAPPESTGNGPSEG